MDSDFGFSHWLWAPAWNSLKGAYQSAIPNSLRPWSWTLSPMVLFIINRPFMIDFEFHSQSTSVSLMSHQRDFN